MSLELQNITKTFGSVVALNDINLNIRENSFVSLVGPSGCGKTTLLRIIAGLEVPDDGKVTFNGEDLTDKTPQNRSVGFIFQNLALYPHMDVRENIEFGLKIKKVGTEERESRIQETTEMLQINELLDRDLDALSGGQRQRVAIAQTLVLNPKIFLLDEPLASLDAKLRIEIRKALQDVHDSLDITTIYVTHDQEQAMTMSEKIAVMNEGNIIQFDEPETIYEDPATPFVGDFIGTPSMNIIRGPAVDGSDQIEIGDSALQVSALDDANADNGKSIGIRPEKLSFSRIGESDTKFTGTIHLIESTGDGRIIYLELGDGQEITVKKPKEEIPDEIRVGEEITVYAPNEDILVF